ncbi:hypothetical protein [Paracoccus lutimaris]|uniref:hypothetical protein n=1 Tax=Paracoccus lutimaris TaxID=1490030 RepID=UPI003CCC8B0A
MESVSTRCCSAVGSEDSSRKAMPRPAMANAGSSTLSTGCRFRRRLKPRRRAAATTSPAISARSRDTCAAARMRQAQTPAAMTSPRNAIMNGMTFLSS